MVISRELEKDDTMSQQSRAGKIKSCVRKNYLEPLTGTQTSYGLFLFTD